MAVPLVERHCVPCEKGAPALAQAASRRLAQEVPGWELAAAGGHDILTRTYRFKGFMHGVELVNLIARVAEAEGHHPDLALTYGSLTVTLWTHAAGGLTENDFILAARIDKVAVSP